MKFDVETTDIFERWFRSIGNRQFGARILTRIDQIRRGNFGDRKNVGRDLFELRFFFGSGYRIYYTVRSGTVVLLLCGGDKSSQQRDIKRAKEIVAKLK